MTRQKERVTEEQLKHVLDNKEFAESLLLTERLLLRNPTDERFLLMIGRIFEVIESTLEPAGVYQKVVELVPAAYNTHLMLGRFYQAQGEVEKTFKHYVSALRTANGAGFWLNKESTAPWVAPFVVQAVTFVERYRLDVIESWVDELQQRFGSQEVERVVKGIRMYSRKIPTVYEDERQRPGFLYIPGLPAKPVFERSDLPFIDYYESQFKYIQAELNVLIEKKVAIENYRDEDKHGTTTGGDWDAKFFYRHGQRYDDTHSLCPKTSEVLSNLPLVHINNHSPEVCFSVLRPGAHLLPHRGITNSRSVLHMGLQIPQNCALNIVDIEQMHWQPGKVFAFDDNYLHEAWNRSDESRYVLLADIWNPYLTESEREAVTYFVEKVGDLNNLYPPQKILN